MPPSEHEHEQTERKWNGESVVPAAALQFAAGVCEFQADDDRPGVPVSLVARSGEPVDHWYWGPQTVHDFAGMQRKDRVPIDWVHTDELMGYLDEFDTSGGDLEVSGRVVPYAEDDHASEVIFKAKAGVPYEASIAFYGGATIEDVGVGQTAQVNGRQVEGPATIFRKWSLRAVAICPYGMDRHTETRFSEDASETFKITVLKTQESQDMSDTPAENTSDEEVGVLKQIAQGLARLVGRGKGEADPPSTDSAAAAGTELSQSKAGESAEKSDEATPREQLRAEMKQFTDAFGEKGAAYYADEKTFAEAAVEHIAKLNDQIKGLEAKLAAVDRGEIEPAEFQGEDDTAAAKFAKKHPDAGEPVSRIAALIAAHRRN